MFDVTDKEQLEQEYKRLVTLAADNLIGGLDESRLHTVCSARGVTAEQWEADVKSVRANLTTERATNASRAEAGYQLSREPDAAMESLRQSDRQWGKSLERRPQ